MHTRNHTELPRSRALIRSLSLALAVAIALFAFVLPALAESPAPAAAEGCPGTTTLIATFTFDGQSWTGTGATTVAVVGDGMLAHWWSATKVTGLVITAGSVTQNFVNDPPETAGTVAASDVQDADGGAVSKIGFCSGDGAVPNPSSGSKISVGVTKTAECATPASRGDITVNGVITIVRHSPPGDYPAVAIRVRVARDTVYAGATILSQTPVSALVGAVMQPSEASMAVPYSVTFAPGASTSFSNQIQIVVEEAATGLERHKYYNARADFGICATPTPSATPTPTPTPSATPTPTQSVSPGRSTPTPTPTPAASTKAPTQSPEQGVQAARGTPGGVPNTSTGATPDSPWVPLFALTFLTALVALCARNLRDRRA